MRFTLFLLILVSLLSSSSFGTPSLISASQVKRPTSFLEAFIQQVQPSIIDESECLRVYRENSEEFGRILKDFSLGQINTITLGVKFAILFHTCNINLFTVYIKTAFSSKGIAGMLYRVWMKSNQLWEAIAYSRWTDEVELGYLLGTLASVVLGFKVK